MALDEGIPIDGDGVSTGTLVSQICAAIRALRTAINAGGVDKIKDDDGDTKIQVEEGADEDKIRFDTAGSERMVILADGKVGIGINTPLSLLHIKGTNHTYNIYEVPVGKVAGFIFKKDVNDFQFGTLDAGHIFRIYDYTAGINAFTINGGKVGIRTLTPRTALTVDGTVTLKEQAAADGDTVTYGQLWVKTATPNELWFTDDAGTDHQIAYV